MDIKVKSENIAGLTAGFGTTHQPLEYIKRQNTTLPAQIEIHHINDGRPTASLALREVFSFL